MHPNPREPFGIAPLEAMASGLPLAAPSRGEVTSYANGENAWVVSPQVSTFAAAIREIASNKSLRIQKTGKALETAQQYSWNYIASSFLDLYAKLHRAARVPQGTLPAPAFHSTPISGLQAALFRGVSQTAQKTFALVSELAAS